MKKNYKGSEELKTALEGIAALPVTRVAAPTPEVEPVAYRKFNPRWGDYTYVSNPYPNASCEPLYTHPDQSELVKAARELIDAYNRALPFHALMCNLDAALDKVKP